MRAFVLVALVLASTAAFAQKPSGKPEILWLGQSAIRITTPSGKIIVIDPFLTKNPKTPAEWKNLDKLGKVDVVLVTHAHGDHLGDAVDIVRKNNAQLFAPAGLAASLVTLGSLPQNLANRMSQGGHAEPLGPDGPKITMVHAEHNSELLWHNPTTDKDETHFGGEPCGFIIELENGYKIYHMGDTGLFGDMKLIAERYKPDLVLMPIGGGPYVMDPSDAAYATKELLHAKAVLPFHYGTTPALSGTPDEYKKALGKTSTQVYVLTPGDKVPL